VLVGIADSKTGKVRCRVSLPLHRKDEGELIRGLPPILRPSEAKAADFSPSATNTRRIAL
jgi:hypothetical protein